MTATADPRWWDCPTLDTDQHLIESLGKPLTMPDRLAESVETGWATEQEDALCRWFARLKHQPYEHVTRDNTYNSENDLSANFVFSVFAPVDRSEWFWCDDVFVVVEKHLGGDVRGNYGPAEVYCADNIGETGFLDWVCGWWASPINPDSVSHLADLECRELGRINDQLAIGWSSHPTSHMRDLLAKGCEPVWSERLGCYVTRFDGVPFATKIEPVGPYYG